VGRDRRHHLRHWVWPDRVGVHGGYVVTVIETKTGRWVTDAFLIAACVVGGLFWMFAFWLGWTMGQSIIQSIKGFLA
jgi:hypothetical protein